MTEVAAYPAAYAGAVALDTEPVLSVVDDADEQADEFVLSVRAHADHVMASYRKPANEAQAVQSLVMPFLTALGYDRDNLDEVARE